VENELVLRNQLLHARDKPHRRRVGLVPLRASGVDPGLVDVLGIWEVGEINPITVRKQVLYERTPQRTCHPEPESLGRSIISARVWRIVIMDICIY
jgi:hypothetical protein